ncbi:MAG: twin-arginine translocase subunit TatC [Spirochaetes bacterium]|nr:twin-arginine translocase subunit TatC [Spirochaetota bacterium]
MVQKKDPDSPKKKIRKLQIPQKAVSRTSRKTKGQSKDIGNEIGSNKGANNNRSSNEKKENTTLIDQLLDEETPNEVETVDPEALERGDRPMTIVEHLDELRSRLLIILASLIVMMLVAFGFSDHILTIIARPFSSTGQKLNLFTIFEGFTLRLKSSLFVSILICLPLIVYHIWKYIEPAINRNDRNIVRITLIAGIFLFYSGTAFAYFFLPLAIMALMGFTPPDMLITNNATEYFNFFLLTSIILGAVFELPIVILILTKIGLISPVFLTSKRKYAIVIIWIIAALASPGPDPLSQALLAFPLMFLYELSIAISKLMVRRKKKRELQQRT